MHGNKKPQSNEFARALALLSQIAITIIACIAIGIFAGWYLDHLLGTSPWLILIFTFLGIGAAFKSILDFAKKV
jgi:ATP synthase protein I